MLWREEEQRNDFKNNSSTINIELSKKEQNFLIKRFGIKEKLIGKKEMKNQKIQEILNTINFTEDRQCR